MAEFRSRNFQTLPLVIKNLIIINGLIFLAKYTLRFEEIDLDAYMALRSLNYADFEWWHLFTYMFDHADWAHVFFNMFLLWMVGAHLENIWGPQRFLLFYLACGVGAGIVHILLVKNSFVIGASGAVMGVLAGMAYLFPNSQMYIIPIPFPIKMKWVAILYIAGDLIAGIANNPYDRVAHFAHLGGALTGLIIVLIWNKSNRRTFY